MLKWLRKILAAFAFGAPRFDEKAAEKHTEPQPIEHQINKGFAQGGTIETRQHRQHQEYTIAGGPGSDNIGARFAALPAAERQRMLDARKGIIRQLQPGEENSAYPVRRGGTDAIANALRTRYDRGPSGKLKPKEEYKHDAEAYAQPRVEEDTVQKK